MDSKRFDDWTRAMLGIASRRVMLRGLAASALVAARPGFGMEVAAAKTRHHRRKKQRKITRNAFGCVDVGKFCKRDGQCCSGRCRGKKEKKTCQAHDTGNCPAGAEELFCRDTSADVSCVSSDGTDGLCDTTTGNAPFCTKDGDCFPCTRDADCVPFCGPQAACIVCSDCLRSDGTPTACVSASAPGCHFPPS